MWTWLTNLFADRTFGAARSSRWSAVRRDFLEENPYCAVCMKEGSLEVHHIRPFHLFPQEELNPMNLVTLCSDHHILFGHLGNFKSYNLEVLSDANYFREKIATRP